MCSDSELTDKIRSFEQDFRGTSRAVWVVHCTKKSPVTAFSTSDARTACVYSSWILCHSRHEGHLLWLQIVSPYLSVSVSLYFRATKTNLICLLFFFLSGVGRWEHLNYAQDALQVCFTTKKFVASLYLDKNIWFFFKLCNICLGFKMLQFIIAY